MSLKRGVFLTQDEPEGVEEAACWGLKISMENGERLSLEQIRAFLEASEELRFEAENREELYGWVRARWWSRSMGGWKREGKGV